MDYFIIYFIFFPNEKRRTEILKDFFHLHFWLDDVIDRVLDVGLGDDLTGQFSLPVRGEPVIVFFE
jgi:hypothetical protein